MTVMRDSHGVVRGGGVAGWALLPAQVPEGGWPLRPAEAAPVRPEQAPAVEPVAEPEAADDLVALVAALNGPGRAVYVDRREQYAWLASS
ncbi:hypothetical protein [Streptomyces sp. NBC_01207]|uniref:hypothetical protein n=1 Tax=Streptomyces sp. NBC_01207 TaxID=2903772 RepID=UPI002E1110D8|nr:hypothetical protein OG457_49675 [Streptomyces sp. NBC_01207]